MDCDDTFIYIMDFLNEYDRIMCSRVCKRWYHLNYKIVKKYKDFNFYLSKIQIPKLYFVLTSKLGYPKSVKLNKNLLECEILSKTPWNTYLYYQIVNKYNIGQRIPFMIFSYDGKMYEIMKVNVPYYKLGENFEIYINEKYQCSGHILELLKSLNQFKYMSK